MTVSVYLCFDLSVTMDRILRWNSVLPAFHFSFAYPPGPPYFEAQPEEEGEEENWKGGFHGGTRICLVLESGPPPDVERPSEIPQRKWNGRRC